jgi:hypothetical protein
MGQEGAVDWRSRRKWATRLVRFTAAAVPIHWVGQCSTLCLLLSHPISLDFFVFIHGYCRPRRTLLLSSRNRHFTWQASPGVRILDS